MPEIGRDKSKLLILSYHYIRDSIYPYPGIHSLTSESFREQILFLKKNFHSATPDEIEEFVNGNYSFKEKAFFITFDDGLKDQYIQAIKVLNELAIKAAFFIPSLRFTDNESVYVNKIHWLRSNTEPIEFFNIFQNFLPENFKNLTLSVQQQQLANDTYIFDNKDNQRLKFLINFVLPESVVHDVAKKMFNFYSINEVDFCNKFLMGASEIKELSDSGHIIGAHGHTHSVFSRLSEEDLISELNINISTLFNLTKIKPKWVAYPFGREESIPLNKNKILSAMEFNLGFTMLPGWNYSKESRFMLKRISPNHLSNFLD